MDSIDKATRWSLGVWAACVLALSLLESVSWSAWFRSSDAPAWVQAFGSIAAILAGAGGIAWQARTQRRHELQREIKAELAQVRDLREFLLYADHYLGMISGTSMDQGMYVHFLKTNYFPANMAAAAEVFDETHSREVPGPLLKLAFKHCAKAFKAMRHRADYAHETVVGGSIGIIAAIDREQYVKLRDIFLKNRKVFDDRIAELEQSLKNVLAG